MREQLITPAGLARLTAELERLRTDGRREIAERLRRSIATDADARENADYQAAREEQAVLEARIARLKNQLVAARVTEPDAANGRVDLGERVRLRDLESGRRLEYEVVGSLEADPTLGRISSESPLGRALLGRRRGEVAVVEAPRGPRHVEIVDVLEHQVVVASRTC
jgi:transcription elongation factor GreA